MLITIETKMRDGPVAKTFSTPKAGALPRLHYYLTENFSAGRAITTEPLVWGCHSRTYINPRMR